MSKPIYSRYFDDDLLPASQVIDDADDSDDDFHARLALRHPKQIVRKVRPRTEATSPVLSKSKRTLEWENLAKPNISALIDQSLRKGNTASSKAKRSENNRGDQRSIVKKQKASSRKTNNIRNEVNITPKQPLSLKNYNLLTLQEKPCKTPKQNISIAEPTNETESLARATPFFDASKINVIDNKNDETPSSPILSSKNRSKNTSKISSKLLLPPDSDETEDEITSPVFSKKRKFAAKEFFNPDHTSVRRKLIKSVDENDELEILNTGEHKPNTESTEGKISSKQLSDSFSDCDIIEASDNEEEKQNRSKRKSGSLEKKIADQKIVDIESDLNDTLLPAEIVDDTETELDDTVPFETDVIPESPSTPASQFINSDEEFSSNENEAPKPIAASRFVFDDDVEEEVDENSVAALLATESKVSISSIGSVLASDPSNSSLDPYQALSDHEKGLLEDIMKSAKKRKPVVGGLRKRLEKTVHMNKSMRAIRCHQIRELNDKPKNFLLLKVTNLKISYLSSCKISGYDIRTKKEYFLFLNSELCPKILKLNDTVRILPPWSIVPKQGKNMIVGVLQFDILSVKEIKEIIGEANYIDSDDNNTIAVDKDDTKSERIVDMRCDCVATGKGTLCCDHDGAPCHSLIKYLSILQGSGPSKRGCKRSARLPAAFLHRIASYPKREVESVSDLVKRFAGICVTPDSQSLSNSAPSILEVRILQPLVQYKNYGIYRDTDIGFIAEDKTGQFIIIKLDSDVVDSPAQWKKFADNAWEELLGSIIRISGLFPHSRMLTNRSSRLAKLLSMFHRPKQTYIYTFKVFPCSHYQIVRRNLEKLSDLQLPDIHDLSYPLNFRIQMKCIVVHSVEDRERHILVHSQKHFTPHFIKIYHNKEAILPTVDECPALVSLYGLYQESADKFLLDHYSACVLIQKRVQFPYKDTITAELPDTLTCRAELPEELSPVSYQLVRLNGKISEVCVDDCIQWLDCGECWSKEILDLEDERLCNVCQASFIRNNIKLVVKLCGQKIHLLQSTAFKLLTNKYASMELHEAGDNDEDNTEDEIQSRLLMYDSSLQPSLVIGKMVDILVFKLNKDTVWTQVPS